MRWGFLPVLWIWVHQGVMSELLLAKRSCAFPWAQGEQNRPTHSSDYLGVQCNPILCHETSFQAVFCPSWQCSAEVNFCQMGISNPSLEDHGTTPSLLPCPISLIVVGWDSWFQRSCNHPCSGMQNKSLPDWGLAWKGS